jgi:DNA-binding response OmpR family regulator
MDEKICQVLLIISDSRVAGRHRVTLRVAGFEVRRLTDWSDDMFDFDPEVVVVQLPGGHGIAADVATRLRAKARFAPLILLGLSSSTDFEEERRTGRHSGFDEVFRYDVDPTVVLAHVQKLLAARPPLTPCSITPPAA